MLLPINAPGPQGRHTVTGCGLKFLYARVQPLTSGPELYIIEALLILASTAYLYRIDIKLQGRVKSGARVAPLNLAGRGTSSNSSFRALRVSMEDGRVLGSGNSTRNHLGGDKRWRRQAMASVAEFGIGSRALAAALFAGIERVGLLALVDLLFCA